jgi:hypothetical protein
VRNRFCVSVINRLAVVRSEHYNDHVQRSVAFKEYGEQLVACSAYPVGVLKNRCSSAKPFFYYLIAALLKVVSYNACPAYTVGKSLVSAGDKPPCIRVAEAKYPFHCSHLHLKFL